MCMCVRVCKACVHVWVCVKCVCMCVHVCKVCVHVWVCAGSMDSQTSEWISTKLCKHDP